MRHKLVTFLILLWMILLGYKIFNPATRDGEKFFSQLSPRRIDSIDLRPLSGIPPIGRTIRIEGNDQIDHFAALWKGADTFIANHPKDVWSVAVSFHTDRGIYGGTLRATSNQGIIFDFDESPTNWPVASQYRLAVSRDQVEATLKDIK